MNENIIKGKWQEIRGDIQKAWGRLTNDELEATKGDAKAIAGLIQKKYGEKEEGYKNKLNDIFRRFEDRKDESVNRIKENLKH